ncbi:MAG TPA: hypothetical protein VF172_12860 [Nitrososphaera sp.]|jgi:hypothetical protein
MNYRFLAFALVASLLAFGASAVALSGSAYAQGDDVWYPGEGVKQDMFVTYRIQELDTNDERPYEMTLYFQEQQDGDWIVPAFVVDDDGSVIEGTMKLSQSMAYLAGGSDVPQEMNDYIGGYSGSLHWLDSFTTRAEPKSLAPGTNWGRTGSIGGSDIIVSGPETITVEAGQFDTTLLTLHKGVTSRIWVMNEFPFPIKAEFFTDSATGNQQIQYKFELLETGMGRPEAPSSTERIPTPPITGKTGRGEYTISLDWEPASIEPGKPVIFSISLSDRSGFPLERANYDFIIKNSSGGVIQEFRNQNADAEFGTGTHEVVFDSPGGMTATVIVNSVSGLPAGGAVGFTENVDFNIVVVPEFPVSAVVVAAAVVGLVVLMTRAKSAGLGGLFGSKGTL